MAGFGKLQQTGNLDKKSFLAATGYWAVLVTGPDGVETLLLTEKELERVRERVRKNPEDTQMVPTAWDKFCAWLP